MREHRRENEREVDSSFLWNWAQNSCVGRGCKSSPWAKWIWGKVDWGLEIAWGLGGKEEVTQQICAAAWGPNMEGGPLEWLPRGALYIKAIAEELKNPWRRRVSSECPLSSQRNQTLDHHLVAPNSFFPGVYLTLKWLTRTISRWREELTMKNNHVLHISHSHRFTTDLEYHLIGGRKSSKLNELEFLIITSNWSYY